MPSPPSYTDSGSTIADEYGKEPKEAVLDVVDLINAIFRKAKLPSPLDDETAFVSDEADEIVIALQTRQRLDLAEKGGESYWSPLGDVLREMGHDPAEFGLE